MKTAVLVNQSTGYLMIDICNAFADNYDRVILLAGKVDPLTRNLSKKIEIVQICQYDKSSIVKRLKTWIRGSLQIKKYLQSLDDEVDVLYFTNPPMSYLWADKMKHKFGIVEYDIYPDALKNVKCPRFVINWWSRRNKEIFQKATGIITLSEGMKSLLSKYCNSSKIRVVYNWGAEKEVDKVAKDDNVFVKAYNLNDKFVVMYSGNIGYTHNVEVIIDLAYYLNKNDKIRFLIIGEGGKKKDLEKKVRDLKLNNVIFSTYLPSDQMKYSFSCADMGIVTLSEGDGQISVPSKTYNLLSYGLPMLVISSTDSELNHLISKYECGGCFERNEIEKIADFICASQTNSKFYNSMSANSFMAAKDFTYDNSQMYVELFKS